MPSERPENVRPTRRCLDDLGVAVPNLGVVLSGLEHPLVGKAQRLPAEENAGRAETIKSLTDRRWYKVKVSSWRGAGGSLEGELPDATAFTRWLMASRATPARPTGSGAWGCSVRHRRRHHPARSAP